MHAIVALGLKDLRLLLRVKARSFFTLIWPLLISVLFGFVFGNGRGGPHVAGTPRNAFEMTFVQGMLWGIIGCTMTSPSASSPNARAAHSCGCGWRR